jgi:ParB/RepB/Spo0J family partition protein
MRTTKTTRTCCDVNIADIVSASENLRDAAPCLGVEGYGVFCASAQQPESLVSLALSTDTEQQARYVKLIEDYEPDIESLAANMATMGLLEPVRVRPAEDKGKYDLVFGCRRCLAWLSNHAKTAGRIPARLTVEIVDSDAKKSLLSSLSENIRCEPSPIDEAHSFRKLEKVFGMKVAEIAAATGKDPKVVRERLKLLKLSEDLQAKVHSGKLAQHRALAQLGAERDKEAALPTDPRRLPRITEIEKLYGAQLAELPAEYAELVTEDVRNLFAHWLQIKYAPRAEIQLPATGKEDNKDCG